jgi:hypothetical protein
MRRFIVLDKVEEAAAVENVEIGVVVTSWVEY